MRSLSFLGTGNGMPTQSSVSCLLLEDEGSNLLIDAGGGHDIINQFKKLGKNPTDVQNIFISHYDSDHILGIVPLIRAFRRSAPAVRTIFCNPETRLAIESLFAFVARHHYEAVKPNLRFVELDDRMRCDIGNWKVTFFDVLSGKTPQSGCKIQFSEDVTLAFLGDEPLRDSYKDLVMESTVLVHEAFCLDEDKEEFKPHEKHHGTVKETAQNAELLHAQTLVLFHMEDKTLDTRKKRYTEEAKKYFSGKIVVPVDGEQFIF